jgi:biotin transporter BioY
MTPRTALILSFVVMFVVGVAILGTLAAIHVADKVFVAGFLWVLSVSAVLASELVSRYLKKTSSGRSRR